WPLYPLQPDQVYVNFGFWGNVTLPPGAGDGFYNRQVEDKVTELGGHKGLYSTSYYSREEFSRLYNGPAYAELKHAYDPDGRLARLVKAPRLAMSLTERRSLLAQLGGPKLLLKRVPPPPQEVRVNRSWMSGRRHSRRRDASAISHHYDVSNTFYEWVLGPSMAYTCACFPTEDATLEQAQFHKFDLVSRKIGLKPGMRLLDVGCGWGGMVMHAAREY